MAETVFKKLLLYAPAFAVFAVCLWGLIFHPAKIADGVRWGLLLLGEKVIPSLFPFMVFSSCVSKTTFFYSATKLFEKLTLKTFKISGAGFGAIILGLLGGYPVGAKTVSDFYLCGKISKNEAQRLICWCTNPAPAFVITAVGTLMLSSYKTGLLLYASSLLSAFTIGFFSRFFHAQQQEANSTTLLKAEKNIFVNSVAQSGETMLGICGWLLTFSAISSLTDVLIPQKNAALFLKALAEVTTGCQRVAEHSLPVPIISALLGFGGFAVIFQVNTYIRNCEFPLKTFICIKLLNGAMNAFFCSLLIKIFPQATEVYVTLNAGSFSFPVSQSITTAVILLIMCALFVIEVDNKRKVC